MRNHVTTQLNSSTEKILEEIKQEKFQNKLQETSLLYIRFRVSIEPLRPIISEMNKKSNHLQIYLMDCFDCYYQKRNILLNEIVTEKIKSLISEGNLINLVRVGCSYLIQTYIQEIQLFENFFKNENLEIISLLENYSNFLYEGLRSLIIKVNDIEILCDIILILRNEILNEAIKPRQIFLDSFSRIVHKMQQDVQERLIFKSFSFIQDSILNFKPKHSQLNYPEILTEEELSVYPTLSMTLKMLNRLYLCLDRAVFEGIAQTSCSTCTVSLINASDKIRQTKGFIDSQLFLLKHLFLLREQMVSFDMNFMETNVSLDFSHIIPGFSKFLQGKSSMKISNLFFEIFSQSSPRILIESRDSKKNLDDQINSSCESFILNVTRLAFDPIILLLKKYSILSGETKDQEKPKENEILEEFNKAKISLDEIIQELKLKLILYIKDFNHLKNLIVPIKGSLMVTFEQFLTFIEENFDSKDSIKSQIFSIDELKEHIDELKFIDPNEIL
jgi:conserved oligomeric Golgi complex subunit 3